MNDEQLTQAIRHSFDRYELAVPVSEVMADHIARPRRWRLVAVSAVAATVVLVLAIVTQSLGRPQAAFASWTAVPGVPDPALAAAAESDCPVVPSSRSRMPSFSHLPLVAQDRRGQAALMLFSDGDAVALCLILPDRTKAMSAGQRPPLHGTVEILTAIRAERTEGETATLLGQVADTVTTVDIVRDDGLVVVATVKDGFFLAWWPGPAEASEVRAYDASGHLLATMPGLVQFDADER
ncbi:MAG: hypothetical protein M3406_08150 [Chloroflexota bacterium]|nr:hypothetical protein [Chloroflexota bacterium]